MKISRFLLIIAAFVYLGLAPGIARAQSVSGAGFSDSGATLLHAELTLPISLVTVSSVFIYYYDRTTQVGTRVRVPVIGNKIIIDPVGNQGGLGHTIYITDTLGTGVLTPINLKINESNWGWFGNSFVSVIPSLPEPGRQPPLVFVPPRPELIEIDPIAGPRTSQVIAGSIDLFYTSLGGDNYAVSIIGDDSFIRLENETYIAFPDTSDIGTILITPGSTSGVFAFPGIGFSGVWSYDPVTGDTSMSATGTSPFAAPSLSFIPEWGECTADCMSKKHRSNTAIVGRPNCRHRASD